MRNTSKTFIELKKKNLIVSSMKTHENFKWPYPVINEQFLTIFNGESMLCITSYTSTQQTIKG